MGEKEQEKRREMRRRRKKSRRGEGNEVKKAAEAEKTENERKERACRGGGESCSAVWKSSNAWLMHNYKAYYICPKYRNVVQGLLYEP